MRRVSKTPGSSGAASLGTRAARGAASIGLAQLARILLQVVSVVVLSRLLSPEDYGLVAMVLVLIGVGELVRDLGLSSAAIQAKSLTREQRDNLFWINSALGAGIGVAVAASAPLIAAFYGHDELVAVTLAMAPTFLLSGLATQHRAALTRDLRFGALAFIDISCSIIGLASGIAIAAADHGYWALVGQQLISGVAFAFAVITAGGWLPRRYQSGAGVRPLIHLGGSVLGSQLLTYATNNVDSLVVGTRFGTRDLGYYNRGLQLVRTPMNMARTTITTVALPVLSRLQDDPDRFVKFAMRGQLAICLPVLLAVSWVVSTGSEFVHVVLGPQWVSATDVIRLIAIGEGLSTLMIIVSTSYVALGLGRQLLHFSVAVLGLRILLVAIGLNWGVIGVAAAYAIGPAIVFPLALWQVSRATGLELRGMLSQGLEIAAIAVISCLASIAALRALNDPGIFVTFSIAVLCHLVVIGMLCVLPRTRRLFRETLDSVRLTRQPSTSSTNSVERREPGRSKMSDG